MHQLDFNKEILISRMHGANIKIMKVYTLLTTHIVQFQLIPRHQPAATWVNTTRYCKYSQVFLMMGKNVARNLELTRNNKLTYIVASCWLLSQLYHDARIRERQD